MRTQFWWLRVIDSKCMHQPLKISTTIKNKLHPLTYDLCHTHTHTLLLLPWDIAHIIWHFRFQNGLWNLHSYKWSAILFSFRLSPEIYRTVWRTWHFIACSDESWLNYQFSLDHSCICSWMVRRICIMSLRVKGLKDVRKVELYLLLNFCCSFAYWSCSSFCFISLERAFCSAIQACKHKKFNYLWLKKEMINGF